MVESRPNASLKQRMNLRPAPVLALGLALGAILDPGPADAHPHVFVTSRSEVVFSPGKAITGIRHAWTFDPAYSSYVTQGLDLDHDGKLSSQELKALAEENTESLKEFDYFTFAKANGRKQAFDPPREPTMTYEDGKVVMRFLLPLAKPVPSSSLFAVEVNDPSFFVYFELVPDANAVTLSGAPAGCLVTVSTAKGLDMSQVQAMADNSFPLPTGDGYSNKAIVACP